MLVTEIIYSNLLRLLSEITNDEAFEIYYNALPVGLTKDNFLTIGEGLDTQLTAITGSKDAIEVHATFEPTLNLLQTLQEQYPTFLNHRIKEIQLIIALINKFRESIEGLAYDITIDFNIESLNLVEVQNISHKNFQYYDPADLKNSLILFDFSDIPSTIIYLTNNLVSRDLILNLLSRIGTLGMVLSNQNYVLINSKFSTSASKVWSSVCLHLVKSGHSFHTPYDYSNIPVVNAIRRIKIGLPYQQFADSLIILSEYNYQKDILDKYLRLYHVVENFMYKYPLSQLERKYDQKVFSIRDFQIMNDSLDKNELAALTDLVKRVAIEDYDPHIKFNDYIFNGFTNLNPGTLTDARINNLLIQLNIKTGDNHATFAGIIANPQLFQKIFPKLIYSFRNSLVHNRETEFHLNHFTLVSHPFLGDTAKIFLESFLIPTIEEIVFYLIINKNDLVWYKNSTLKLWDKTIQF